jgi:hypothetical protein
MGDAEEVADAGADRQRGLAHRPILGDAAAVVRADRSVTAGVAAVVSTLGKIFPIT